MSPVKSLIILISCFFVSGAVLIAPPKPIRVDLSGIPQERVNAYFAARQKDEDEFKNAILGASFDEIMAALRAQDQRLDDIAQDFPEIIAALNKAFNAAVAKSDAKR